MVEINGDLWEVFKEYKTLRVIPTNGYFKSNGELIMGAGVALQAKKKFVYLPRILGEEVKKNGNIVHIVDDYQIASFPTKDVYWNNSSIELIERSTIRLYELTKRENWDYVVLPHVGCGLGGLDWEKQVKPLLQKYLTEPMYVSVNEKE